jgi:hypothetical protein
MNRGGFWKVPKWFFAVFMQFLTPVCIIVLLFFSTRDYIKAGYFKLIPEMYAKTPALVPWAVGARIMLVFVLALGFYQSYKSIKNRYSTELKSGQVSIRK